MWLAISVNFLKKILYWTPTVRGWQTKHNRGKRLNWYRGKRLNCYSLIHRYTNTWKQNWKIKMISGGTTFLRSPIVILFQSSTLGRNRLFRGVFLIYWVVADRIRLSSTEIEDRDHKDTIQGCLSVHLADFYVELQLQ